MSEHFLNVKAFLGTDNTSDLASVSVQRKNGIFFREIDNVDIDDAGKPHMRFGHGSSLFSGTNVRSVWANDNICLFADGTILKCAEINFTSNPPIVTNTNLIYDVDPTDPFCYVEHGSIVYFSNNSIIGYIDTNTKLPYPFPSPYLPPIRVMDKGQTVLVSNPAIKFKMKMIGGHILEWYNSRLLVANGSNLFFSDATIPTQMDRRKNGIAFPNRITMVKAVDDGVYVSDNKNVYFEYGKDASEFSEFKKLDVPAIEGMSVVNKVQGKVTKRAAYWMTKKGPYAGYNEGVVKSMQGGLFNLDGLEIGTAIIKDSTYQQLLMIGKFKSGFGGSSGAFRLPIPTETGID